MIKNIDTFIPSGLFIAAKDKIPNSNNLDLWLKLKGKMMQNSYNSYFVFNVRKGVSYISWFMALLPGDVLKLDIERLSISEQITRGYER
ncbi:MAG: hypothetical protein CSA39_06325 [Flavobacteriales bacterium]|nr:MAG: hypothetical protein CSA39_06325 [Flavobacteriales bacterium]